MGSYQFALRPGMPGDLHRVSRLVREAAEWLRACKQTDQWAKPWPDRVSHTERMLNDLLKGKTWLVYDRTAVIGTITIDPEEPLIADERPVWPTWKRGEPALYVRRVIVSRSHAGIGSGAALLDWAAHVAMKDYRAQLIRVDVWTTNRDLHAFYEQQHFTRQVGRDPQELDDYPSQALFERPVDHPGSDYTRLLTEAEGPDAPRTPPPAHP